MQQSHRQRVLHEPSIDRDTGPGRPRSGKYEAWRNEKPDGGGRFLPATAGLLSLCLQIRFYQGGHLTHRFHLLFRVCDGNNIEISIITGVSHFLCVRDFSAYLLRKFTAMHKFLVEIPNHLRMTLERLELQRKTRGNRMEDGIIRPVIGASVSLILKILLRIRQVLFCDRQSVKRKLLRAAGIIQRSCLPLHTARFPPC